MLDKLVMTSPKTDLTKEKVSSILQGQYSHCTIEATRFHNSVLVYHRSKAKADHLVSIHLEPRLDNINPLKVEINPTHFQTISHLEGFLEQFCDLDGLAISRIDHAVDITTKTVSEVHSMLICSRKKSRELYKNGVDMETFYLGMPPERVVVYNKAIKEDSEGIKTRIEVQQYRHKVAVNNFKNLADCQSINPFKNLKFNELNEVEPESLADKKKVLRLKHQLALRGAQASYKLLNGHSNFKRDFGHLIKVGAGIPNLFELYQANLSGYFKLNTVLN